MSSFIDEHDENTFDDAEFKSRLSPRAELVRVQRPADYIPQPNRDIFNHLSLCASTYMHRYIHACEVLKQKANELPEGDVRDTVLKYLRECIKDTRADLMLMNTYITTHRDNIIELT